MPSSWTHAIFATSSCWPAWLSSGCRTYAARSACATPSSSRGWSGAPVVGGDLDEVGVGVAEVDGGDGTQRPGAGDRPLLDDHAGAAQLGHDLSDGRGGDEAEVGGPRGGPGRVGRVGGRRRVDVELLAPEAERAPPGAEADRLHPEDALVERDRRLDVADGQDQVVQAIDLHRRRGPAPAQTSPARTPASPVGGGSAAPWWRGSRW